MSSSMLQVPNTGAVSLPPSQTPTIVNVPITDGHNDADEVQSIHNSLLPSEMDQPLAADDESQVPQVSLTFLVSSGKRKTFHFDQDSPVAAVKDRLMSEWPTEWENETRPQAASQIRLLHMGRLLSDEETLSTKSHFPPRPAPPTIVHVSIRPFPVRAPSGTGSLKQRASILRASSFARGNTANQRSGDGTQLDSVREQSDSNSGCTCCVIC